MLPCAKTSTAETIQVRRTAHEGQTLEGTKTDHGEPDAGRVVPVPATLAWMLEAQINLNRLDCQLLFPIPRGRVWRERTFYRDLLKPAQEASGLDIRPHECALAMSRIFELRAWTMPTRRSLLGIESRRCSPNTPIRSEEASTRCARPPVTTKRSPMGMSEIFSPDGQPLARGGS